MAKFTVYFKDKIIHTATFDTGVVHIGRDESNDLTVDSLAIAPAHAVVIIRDHEKVIRQLNHEFPLIINDQPITEAKLSPGDTITLGKHKILYTDSVNVINHSAPAADQQADNSFNELLSQNSRTLPDANLQVVSGKHIGRLVPLKKSMTRIGHGNGNGIVIISRRKDGYFISALEQSEQITVNKQPLADKTLHLKNNDIIVIDNIPMQFFLD